jgi:ATP-dependent Lon protease
MTLDELDNLAWSHFQPFVIRKDLVRKAGQGSSLPVYVLESLIARYCSSMSEEEVEAGLQAVQDILLRSWVRPDESQHFISNLTQTRRARLIDKIRVKPSLDSGECTAELPSLGLNRVPIAHAVVQSLRELLGAGMFADIDVECDDTGTHDEPCPNLRITAVRGMSFPPRDWSALLAKGRAAFSASEWKRFLLRSVGYEPDVMSERVWDIILLRLVPFVTANVNAIEIGPRGTGKTHAAFLSPHALVMYSVGIATAKLFTPTNTSAPSPLLTHDVVCFDEADSGTFADKQPVSMMKSFMDGGLYNVGDELVRSDASIIFHSTQRTVDGVQERIRELSDALPQDVRHDVSFMDRLHALIPGWEIPCMTAEGMTSHFGLCAPVLTAWWHQLRTQSRLDEIRERISFGPALSQRDQTATLKIVDGLLKLIWPGDGLHIPDDSIEWAVRLALESRLRIKEQQKALMPIEFAETGFSYRIGEGGDEHRVQCQ